MSTEKNDTKTWFARGKSLQDLTKWFWKNGACDQKSGNDNRTKKTMAIKTKMDSNIEHIKSLGSQTSATDNKIEAASSWSHWKFPKNSSREDNCQWPLVVDHSDEMHDASHETSSWNGNYLLIFRIWVTTGTS